MGDTLFIPKDVYHNVKTLESHALHITSSYYGLPLNIKGKKLNLDAPTIEGKEYADEVYVRMKSFFIDNMNSSFSLFSLFNDMDHLQNNYAFYHLTKPILYIVGLGELVFLSNDDMKKVWEALNRNKALSDEIKSEIKNRIN